MGLGTDPSCCDCDSHSKRPVHGVDQWVSAASLLEQIGPIDDGRWRAILRYSLNEGTQDLSWTLTASGSRPTVADFLRSALVKVERFTVVDTTAGAIGDLSYAVVTGTNDRTVVAEVMANAEPVGPEDDPLPIGLDLLVEVSEGAGLVRWAISLPVSNLPDEDLIEAAVDVLPPGVEDHRTETRALALKVGDNTIIRTANGDISLDVTSANSVVRAHWNGKNKYVGWLDGAPKVGYLYVYLQRSSGANPVDCLLYGKNLS